jgi:hypothetical protein
MAIYGGFGGYITIKAYCGLGNSNRLGLSGRQVGFQASDNILGNAWDPASTALFLGNLLRITILSCLLSRRSQKRGNAYQHITNDI